MQLDQDVCYRAVKGRDRPFDGVLLTRRPHHRHLLPAVLPRDHPPPAQRLGFFPTAAGRAGSRLQRLSPVPARRHTRFAGVGRRCRRRVARDATGLRRRRRARGHRRAWQGHWLLDQPAQPRRHPGVRRRPARARPLASRADGASAHRDHGTHLHRHRLRGRVRQRAAVQRHDPRGVRRHSQPSPGGRGSRRSAEHAVGASGVIRTRICRAGAVRRRRPPSLPGRCGRGRRDGGGRAPGGTPALVAAAARARGACRRQGCRTVLPRSPAAVAAELALGDAARPRGRRAMERTRRLLDADCGPRWRSTSRAGRGRAARAAGARRRPGPPGAGPRGRRTNWRPCRRCWGSR